MANKEKMLAEQRKAQQKAVEDQAKREAEARPTPTQEENDKAALGILGEVESDGSPSEADEAVRRAKEGVKEAEARQASASAGTTYSTRDAKKG